MRPIASAERDGHASKLKALLDGFDAGAVPRISQDGQIEAAVLVPLYFADRELHVVLTKRRSHLRLHAGEICFPGGRRDAGDPALSDTALREAQEEIGLQRVDVELVGALSPTSTIATNYLIHPFVGLVPQQRASTVCAQEVDSVLELSLRALRGAKTRTQLTRRGFTFETDAYELSEHIVWGATFRIVEDLLTRLQPLLDAS